jgi:hypothetical protein
MNFIFVWIRRLKIPTKDKKKMRHYISAGIVFVLLRIHQNTKKRHTHAGCESLWGRLRVFQNKKGEVALSFVKKI